MIRLDGPDSIIGKSVIVHVNPDDFRTQPTGNAGGRVACGVIRQN
jgi:Cu-Zn family superoxide dismutase